MTLSTQLMTFVQLITVLLATSILVSASTEQFTPLIRYCGVPPNKLPPPPPTLPDLPTGAQIYLRQVIALIRHGDRTASSFNQCWNNDTAVWNCELTSTSIANTNRSQTETPTTPRLYRLAYMNGRQQFKGNCATGQLTSKGYQQQLRNGERAALTYVSSGFLSSNLNRSELYIRSSEYTRTIQSAQAYILGMYPKVQSTSSNTEILDIQMIDRKRDDMLLNRDLCPRLRQYEEKAVTSPTYLQHYSRYTQPLLRNLTAQIGSPVTEENLATFHDCLNTHFCHDFEIPVSTSQYLDVREEVAYREFITYSYPSRAAFAQVGLGFLLQEMVGFMNASIAGNINPKFYLLSGHDSSIMPLLTAFDMWNGEWTPYAAQLTFELYDVRTSPSAPLTFGLRLLYDGKVWPIRGCSTTVADLCDIQSFYKLVAPLMPSPDPNACKAQ